MALASTLVGHFRGGLGHVNVLTNTLMGGVVGLVDGGRGGDRQDDGAGDGAARAIRSRSASR